MITFKQVSYKNKRKYLVKDLTFHIPSQSLTGIFGPNGAGKSTTLHLLAQIISPDNGNLIYNGRDFNHIGFNLKKKCGFLPELFAPYPEMRVREYLIWIGQMKFLPVKSLGTEIDRVIELVHLQEQTTKFIRVLSTGARRRLGLAQALINTPEILILDEPLSALDPWEKNHLIEILCQLVPQTTIILATHLLHDLLPICAHSVFLDQGRLEYSGSLLTSEQLPLPSNLSIHTLTNPPPDLISHLSHSPRILRILRFSSVPESRYLVLARPETDFTPLFHQAVSKTISADQEFLSASEKV